MARRRGGAAHGLPLCAAALLLLAGPCSGLKAVVHPHQTECFTEYIGQEHFNVSCAHARLLRTRLHSYASCCYAHTQRGHATDTSHPHPIHPGRMCKAHVSRARFS